MSLLLKEGIHMYLNKLTELQKIFKKEDYKMDMYKYKVVKSDENKYKVMLKKDMVIAETKNSVLVVIPFWPTPVACWFNKTNIFASEYSNTLTIMITFTPTYTFNFVEQNELGIYDKKVEIDNTKFHILLDGYSVNKNKKPV